ncbi:histone deacetylase [Ferrovum sp. PN-J185]|uniref:histone deacetylase family protein n=1 Tax=Ferrovum sp. PN-J185 TaxID=1356306 RepID=UPI00079C120D|nr:histone deacetylase [Ferrovum sp. PN-J185]KXW56600.1 acetoin utilization protein AcuC [Ferrovum sp. PN-J185]MCC6068351.1 histone deacetylase [Ferrovum sp. PN-J185]
MLDVYYSHHFVLPLPPGHRFPMDKYAMLFDEVRQLPNIVFHEAPKIELTNLLLAHDRDYIHRVIEGTLTESEIKEIGFPWSPKMVERSLRSVGATYQAALTALKNQIAVSLAGGTHHAHYQRGSGFCVFNDIAVSALALLDNYPDLRIVIIDLDVHQGDGSAAILSQYSDVFTFSMHGKNNYPFTKEKSDLDIALPDGCNDVIYLDLLENALSHIEEQIKPDFVFYLAGVDPHDNDRLGRLKITEEGLIKRDKEVFNWVRKHKASCTVVMGGGYGNDLNITVRLHANTVSIASTYKSDY